MADMMTFPDTVEEFMEQYKVVDTDGVYMSKGSELIPIFRMRQWFEHLPSAQPDIARDIATIIENEQDMRVILKNAEHTETHSCDCERTETHDWTPVSEALPKDGVTVWVTIRGHDVIKCEDGETLEQAIARISKIRWVTQGYWSEEEHVWNDPSFGCPLMVQPIAWMPIDTPEPWRGGQND